MKRLSLQIALLLASFAPTAAFALQSSSDSQVTGQAGVGTVVPQARLEIKLSSLDAYALQVSSQDGNALMFVDKTGKAGIGVTSPAARLEVGNISNIGLQLRAGNSTSTFSSSQISFAYTSTETFRHSIRTRHVSSQNLGNAMDFFLWQSTGYPTTLGETRVLSLEASTSTAGCSVHVHPTGEPFYELEVSSGGGLTGGGIIHYASVGIHSSRVLKTDIAYLDAASEHQAFEDVKALKHAKFRYKVRGKAGKLVGDPGQPLRQGLIYEDSPESIKGRAGTVVLDARLMNLELALKEADRRILELETLISNIEKAKKGTRR